MQLNKPCPKCHKTDTLTINHDLISCQKAGCPFQVQYACPICDHDLAANYFKQDAKGDFFTCPQCHNKIYLKRIKYLLENALIVDKDTRCIICNGPTIHRKEMNLSHRCFFFPSCAGQADLFGNTKKEELVFLDFETTGLEVGKHEIIEIGALKIDEEGYEHSFQTFVKPNGELDPAIIKLTGITPELLFDAPNLQTSITKLCEFIGTAAIVAHNTDFDIPWLAISCIRHNIPLQATQSICTCRWAERLNEPAKSLTTLTRKYRIFHNNAHRALADAIATKELFFIFENFRKEPRPIVLISRYQEAAQKSSERYSNFVQS